MINGTRETKRELSIVEERRGRYCRSSVQPWFSPLIERSWTICSQRRFVNLHLPVDRLQDTQIHDRRSNTSSVEQCQTTLIGTSRTPQTPSLHLIRPHHHRGCLPKFFICNESTLLICAGAFWQAATQSSCSWKLFPFPSQPPYINMEHESAVLL